LPKKIYRTKGKIDKRIKIREKKMMINMLRIKW